VFDPVRPRQVLEVKHLTPDAFVIRIERRQEHIVAGRHIDVGLPGSETRPYSLYSGEHDPYLDILVRRVEGGNVSTQLAVLQVGDLVKVVPPRGRFTLARVKPEERLLFLATGTGIAPFRSFIRTRPELDYMLVHGVRDAAEDFGAEFAPADRRVLCVSGQSVPGMYSGRLTSWLADADLSAYQRAFLCGNARMIVEASYLLADRGFADRIHSETYF
jgi:ferredoxin-NADP reductase